MSEAEPTTHREITLAGEALTKVYHTGSVEVHAAGSVEQLAALEEGLARGPAGARVDSVESIEAAGDLPDGFEIRGW